VTHSLLGYCMCSLQLTNSDLHTNLHMYLLIQLLGHASVRYHLNDKILVAQREAYVVVNPN